MSKPWVLRGDARIEFDAAADDYENQSPGLGPRFTKAVHRTLDRIGRFPYANVILKRRVRCALVNRFPFAVLYLVKRDRILVIGIVPTKSNPARWQSRT